MLLLVKLGAAITASLDHTTAPRRKGVWHRPATDNKHAQALSRQEVVWITSYTHSGVAIWPHCGPVPEC